MAILDNTEEFYYKHLSLVQYWEGMNYPIILEYSKNWQTMYPELNYRLFNKDLALGFIKEFYPKEVKKAFLKCKLPSMQSDLFRVCYIYKRGGLYIDCAVRPISRLPLEAWKRSTSLYLARLESGKVWNGMIFSRRYNKALKLILNQIVSNILTKKDLLGRVSNNVLWVSGPANYQHLRLAECREKNEVVLIDDAKYYERKDDLPHKQNPLHWSFKQQYECIYNN